MTLSETLMRVWQQALVDGSRSVELANRRYAVSRTRSRGFKVVDFEYEGRKLTGIEQNPDTGSRWAVLARQGQRVMQFSAGRRYFANIAEGKLVRYPAWASLELPE